MINQDTLLLIVTALVIINLNTAHVNEINGYVRLIRQISNDHPKHIQDVMGGERIKLPSISKDVPKLSMDTARQWRFQLLINTHRCDKDLGHFLFNNPAKQSNDDIKEATGNVSAEQRKFDEFVQEFKKNKDYATLLTHAHAEIISTLESEDKLNVMDIPFPAPDKLLSFLLGEYNVNTRCSRSKKIKQFFNMEMEPDETFSSFVSRINTEATEINSMCDAEVNINDGLKLVTLLEGVTVHHEDTFRVVTEVIEQDPKLTYVSAIARMKPVARKHEIGTACNCAQG